MGFSGSDYVQVRSLGTATMLLERCVRASRVHSQGKYICGDQHRDIMWLIAWPGPGLAIASELPKHLHFIGFFRPPRQGCIASLNRRRSRVLACLQPNDEKADLACMGACLSVCMYEYVAACCRAVPGPPTGGGIDRLQDRCRSKGQAGRWIDLGVSKAGKGLSSCTGYT